MLRAPHHDAQGPTSQIALETLNNQVQWGPSITYTNAPPSSGALREPFGPLVYQFSQPGDLRIAGLPKVAWTASAQGVVHIDADLHKQTTTDDPTATTAQT